MGITRIFYFFMVLAGVSFLSQTGHAQDGTDLILPKPAMVGAFSLQADSGVVFREFDIPVPDPQPGPQADIQMAILQSENNLIAAGSLANLPEYMQSKLSLICDRGGYIDCSLRQTLPAIHSRIETLGLGRPENYAHRFYAPYRFSSTLFSDEDAMYCELDDDKNLYVFDAQYQLTGLVKLGLTQIFPRTSPTMFALEGCDMDPAGNIYVAVSERHASGADAVLVKFSAGLEEIFWVTPRMTAKAPPHFVGDRLFTAHGGSGINDYLFEIDPDSGKVIGREPVPTAVGAILSHGNELLISGYDFGYVVQLR